MEGAQDFYFWETMHGGFSLAWERGPHAHEVVEDLLKLAADDDHTRVLRPGDVVLVHDGDADPRNYTRVDIRGVRILLRPENTIGSQAALAETVVALRS